MAAIHLDDATIARLGPSAQAQIRSAAPHVRAAAAPKAGAGKPAGRTGGGRVAAPKPPGSAGRARAVGGHAQRIRTGAVRNLTSGPRVHPAIPINANGSTITVAVAGVVLIVLYRRGVPQAIWKAATASPAKNSAPGNTPVIHSAGGGSTEPVPSGGLPTGAGGQTNALVDVTTLRATEASVAGTRSPSAWLNYCLQFFDDVRSRLGLHSFYGVYDANAVCQSQSLHSGLAPAGAGVCFAGGPNGHIGVADGGDSYTSAGFPGGVQSGPYLRNPSYLGYFT